MTVSVERDMSNATLKTRAVFALSLLSASVLLAPQVQASAILRADYRFANTFESSVAGAPALQPVDPLSTSSFGTDTVFGAAATTYNFTGQAFPTSNQGGLVFDNSAGLLNGSNYSVDMSFKFNERNNAWRRIIDVENRNSDNGFYVDPSNNLDIFPQSGSTSPFTTGAYYDVVLTVNNGTATAYLNGVQQFSYMTTLMNIGNPNNPGNLLNFFIDNVVAGGQGEWSSGSIARLALFDGALTADEIRTNFDTPIPPTTTVPVPEPGSVLLLAGATSLMVLRRRRSM